MSVASCLSAGDRLGRGPQLREGGVPSLLCSARSAQGSGVRELVNISSACWWWF